MILRSTARSRPKRSLVEDRRRPLLFGIEHELLTALDRDDGPDGSTLAANKLVEAVTGLSPALPGPDGIGIFTESGRFYVDHGGHVEFATRECTSPFECVAVIDEQERLLDAAIQELREDGVPLILSTCNHSGLLQCGAPTWGCHDSYLVQAEPADLTDQLLPFIAASGMLRGAGGIHYPSGKYLACSRALFIEQDRGGATTNERAMFSTARREHLTPQPDRFGRRLHLIDGDGQRSQMSRFLKCFTTAIVVKALECSPSVVELPVGQRTGCRGFWHRAHCRFNCMGPVAPNEPPRVDPFAIKIHEQYLHIADGWIDKTPGLPDWIGAGMAIWETCLSAMRQNDYDFLKQRLDPWIKHSIFTRFLEQIGASWSLLGTDPDLFAQLALLNQQYHEFCSDDSPFDIFDRAGALKHRVLPTGDRETTDQSPDTATRATARAEFIRTHAGQDQITVDWDTIIDMKTPRVWTLPDPLTPTIIEILPSH